VRGETGTGKELVARAIHRASKRAAAPLVVQDCSAIPRELVESTLFGHERGSFTGASDRHRGSFEQAHGGTIFLDEIGELPLDMQPKLLRVLENREIRRVGGQKTLPVDVRVVAATNRDLRQMVNEGTFREDLYYRLSVVQVELPSLRERAEDIPLLVRGFLDDFSARRFPGEEREFTATDEAMRRLQSYPWPGNVRELKNTVERAARLHYRLGVFNGIEGAAPAADAPAGTPTVNADDVPRVSGQVRVNLLGKESGFFFQGIYFTQTPLLSLGVGADFEPDALRVGSTTSHYLALSADAFLDLPLGEADELVAQVAFHHYDQGEGSTNTGNGGFVELGWRHEFLQPVVSLDLFDADADTADTLAWRVGANVWISKHAASVKLEGGVTTIGAGATKKSTPSGAIQAQIYF
jgi:hypothetical protein